MAAISKVTVNPISTPLISICIGTYNRASKVYSLVNTIFEYSGNDIEVIVVDNCSTDDTNTLLSSITDERFSYFRNDKNIGGILNPLKALTLAKGKYAFMCLDKDTINPENIAGLITTLNDDPDVLSGFCKLDLTSEQPGIVYEKGFSSVLNTAYLSKHPTGNFYDSNVLKNLKTLHKAFKEQKKFAFYFDLINAEIAMLGKSKVIGLPVFYTETPEECRDKTSFTYNKNDLFFTPNNRLMVFNTYINDAGSLDLSSYDFKQLVKKIYNRELISATFGYKSLMVNEFVCAHYGIDMQKITLKSMWETNMRFSAALLHSTKPLNYISKLGIVFYGHIKILLKSILSKL